MTGAATSPTARVQSRALTGRDFLTRTSFALTGGSAEAGGYAALWGRVAITRFDGREGDLTLDGEVTTGLMGADWAAERWTAGLAVGHARGTGGYREGGGCEDNNNDRGVGGCAGEVEATLTGLWPYAGLKLTDRLSAWAAAGYGAGELKLTPGGATDGPFTTDLTMAMGAAGMRGEVLTPPPEGGAGAGAEGRCALHADRVGGNEGRQGRQPRGGDRRRVAGAHRDRGLAALRARRRCCGDGADAVVRDRGAAGRRRRRDRPRRRPRRRARLRGAEAGRVARPESARAGRPPGVGLPRMGRQRLPRLGTPRPSTDRGLALTLRQSWGGSPTGGMDALLGRETLAGLAANDNGDTTASTGRLEAELGYGIAMFGGGFTGTPHLGVGLSDTGRDYRLDWRLTSARRGDPGFEIGLAATRREAANADAEHGIALRGVIRW